MSVFVEKCTKLDMFKNLKRIGSFLYPTKLEFKVCEVFRKVVSFYQGRVQDFFQARHKNCVQCHSEKIEAKKLSRCRVIP